MRAQIGILTFCRQRFLPLEHLEERDHAVRRLAGRLQQAKGGLVGGALFVARVGHEVAQRNLPRDGLPTDGWRRVLGEHADRGTHERANDHLDGRVLDRLIDPHQVAAGDVAGLVRDHADHFVRILGGGQQAGMDEHLQAAGDEGVDPRIVDDVDLDSVGIEAGRFEDGVGIGPQGCLDLGIADQAVGRSAGDGHQCHRSRRRDANRTFRETTDHGGSPARLVRSYRSGRSRQDTLRCAGFLFAVPWFSLGGSNSP